MVIIQSKNNENVIPEFDLETFRLKAHMHFLTLDKQKFPKEDKKEEEQEYQDPVQAQRVSSDDRYYPITTYGEEGINNLMEDDKIVL